MRDIERIAYDAVREIIMEYKTEHGLPGTIRKAFLAGWDAATARERERVAKYKQVILDAHDAMLWSRSTEAETIIEDAAKDMLKSCHAQELDGGRSQQFVALRDKYDEARRALEPLATIIRSYMGRDCNNKGGASECSCELCRSARAALDKVGK